jgi:hypothetical protein
MGTNMKQSIIEVIENISLGTHFCQFYQTKEDLMEILIPYFKEGGKITSFASGSQHKPWR